MSRAAQSAKLQAWRSVCDWLEQNCSSLSMDSDVDRETLASRLLDGDVVALLAEYAQLRAAGGGR